jgi:hypothetical protein
MAVDSAIFETQVFRPYLVPVLRSAPWDWYPVVERSQLYCIDPRFTRLIQAKRIVVRLWGFPRFRA